MNKIRSFISPKSAFFTVLILSLFTLLLMLFPDIGTFLGPGILLVWSLLTLSGVGLIILTFKRFKEKSRLKVFLLITGFSAAGFFAGVALHNAFYALGTISAHLPLLPALLSFLEVTFFLAAVILCPLGLLTGLIGSILMWKQFK